MSTAKAMLEKKKKEAQAKKKTQTSAKDEIKKIVRIRSSRIQISPFSHLSLNKRNSMFYLFNWVLG